MDMTFLKILLQLGRDISSLTENHSLACRFWGYKIELNIRWGKIKVPMDIFFLLQE